MMEMDGGSKSFFLKEFFIPTCVFKKASLFPVYIRLQYN